MKNVLTVLASLVICSTCLAQEANKIRLKSNPLSPIIAAERNVNLSIERTFAGKHNVMGLQGSAGYIFDWNTISASELVSNVNYIRGAVATTEFRVYSKIGVYTGCYLQYKSINSKYTLSRNNWGQTNVPGSAAKSTTSAGFLCGYNHMLTQKFGLELQCGLGISNKSLTQDGKRVRSFQYLNDMDANLLLENSGRYPQFVVTYKFIYQL